MAALALALLASASAEAQTRQVPIPGTGPALAFELTGPRVIANTNRLKMELVKQEEGAAPNRHPVDLAARQIAASLAAVRVHSTAYPGEPVAPFDAGQAKRIAEALETAFAEASADQDIIMYSFRQVGKSFLTQKRVLTSARVFYDGAVVNVLLGEVDTQFQEYKDYSVHPIGMGSRTGGAATSSGALPGAGYQLAQSRPDWIRIVPASPTQAMPMPGQAVPAAAPQPAPAPPPQGAPAAERVPAAPPSAPPPTAPTAGQPSEAMPVPAPAGRMSWPELEEGLETLKRLWQKGLITEQEYNQKKKELLDAVGPR